MEIKTRLIAHYSQTGNYMYPEDTWDDECVVHDEKSLFNAMKGWHKQSAANFNNSPLGGLFEPKSITFYEQKYIINDGIEFKSEPVECDKPDYYLSASKSYYDLIAFARGRLPKLRKANAIRIEHEKEYSLFQSLKEKFKD